MLPFVSDRPLASINRSCSVIQGQWIGPLDATTQRHTIVLYALSKAVRHEQRSPANEVRCLDHSTTTADKVFSFVVFHKMHIILVHESTHPKFDPTRVGTNHNHYHGSTLRVTEMPVLTTWPSGTYSRYNKFASH